MTGYSKHLIGALTVVVAAAVPVAAGEFGFGLKYNEGRGGTSIGLGFSWSDRPVMARPMVAQPVVAKPVWGPVVWQTYRDVPVFDACGRVVSYRREPVLVQTGRWVSAPAPLPCNGGSYGAVWGKGGGHRSSRGEYRLDNKWAPRYPAPAGPRPVQYCGGGR
ncbi:MAG TPA: hypothetical protein VLM89_09750 [Phycisphaerae bacterium]|nr:hypothetical protein [Phycisphaerae bacterium]